jgi:hypothetical protein
MRSRSSAPRGRSSSRLSRTLREQGHLAEDGCRQLATKYRNHPGMQVDPLYACPPELLQALAKKLPGWFSCAELVFEHDLWGLCHKLHCIGFFHQRPVRHASLSRPPIPVLSEPLVKVLGWDTFWSREQAQALVDIGCQRLDPLHARLDAYRGWLATNPLYLQECLHLKNRWARAVQNLGRIPDYPVSISPGSKGRPPRRAVDVTSQLVAEFTEFYERWDLQGLVTWDLPEPRGPNLSGLALPSNGRRATGPVTIEVPALLSVPSTFPLRTILEEAQQAQTPAHLREWQQIQQQQHSGNLRFLRFRRMFLLHYYRETLLASRYAARFPGNVEALDQAFAQFLGGLDMDSIKKLRLRMEALRRSPS